MKSYFNIYRMVLIPLAVATATMLWVEGFKLPINQGVATVLDGVRAALAAIALPLETVAVTPLVNWLHTQNFAVDLQDHWRAAFILLWLLFGSTAKSFTDSTPAWSAVLWSISGLAALAASLFVGSASLPDPNALLFRYVTFGFAAFLGFNLLLVWLEHRESQAWFFVYFLIAGVFAAARRVLLIGMDAPVLATLPSPGLAMVAIIFTLLGATNVFVGAFLQEADGETIWQRWLRSNLTRCGFDILIVIGGAGVLVYVATA
jgi:hypothetical protein